MKITLKRSWRSPRGKLYPAGTVFIKSKRIIACHELAMTWYDFYSSDGSYGFVLMPDSLLQIPTPEEISIRASRQKLIDAHIAATSDPFLIN